MKQIRIGTVCFPEIVVYTADSLRPYDRRIKCRPPIPGDFHGLQRKLQTKKNGFLLMQTVFSRCIVFAMLLFFVGWSYCFAFLCRCIALYFPLFHFIFCLKFVQVADTKNMPIKCIHRALYT